jgi:hypothetical protein
MSSPETTLFYSVCKDEVNQWLNSKDTWISPINILSTAKEIFKFLIVVPSTSIEWEKQYLNDSIPLIKNRWKEQFENYELPKLESLAEHYVNGILPFHSQLVDEIIDDNVKQIVDLVYQEFVKLIENQNTLEK